MKRFMCLILFFIVISPPTIHRGSFAQEAEITPVTEVDETEIPVGSSDTVESGQEANTEFLIDQLEGPFEAEDIATTSGWIQASGITELLGPLTPLALSPFFGVTCLSAMSLWGPEWAATSPMLGTSGALRSETIFITFLLLTIITSIPRFTKVSKPIAQAVDRLEAYAVIVILLVIKIAASLESGGQVPVAMIQMGMFSMTFDTLLAIAMIVNVLIINSVKFFFEFLAWLTPVPFLDALFELCNKTLCLGLMAIYALSPMLATVINLAFFLVAAILFRCIYRRTRFYRSMILDPVLARLWPPYGKPRRAELIVFNRSEIGDFPAKSRLRLQRCEDKSAGWRLQESRWWLPQREHHIESTTDLTIQLGWIMNSVQAKASDTDACVKYILTFSRRYNPDALRRIADQLGIPLTADMREPSNVERALEFS